jgi:hypothetical protein
MKHKTFLTMSVCLATLICTSVAMSAAEKKSKSASTSASPAGKETASPAASPAKTERAIPLRRGMISAVDEKAKTFTIAGKESSRVFKVTGKTVITKNGSPATFKDLAPNEEVTGSYWKAADGTLEAKTVKLGPKGEKKSEEGKKAKTSSSSSESPATSPASSPKP